VKARNLTAAALVLAALAATSAATPAATPAFASISTGNLGQDVQSALGSGGNVSVTLEDGTATLTNADVDQVVDLLQY